MTNVTATVAEFIAHTELHDVPSEVTAQGKRCLIDGFGVILAGSTEKSSGIVREQIARAGGADEATILGVEVLRAPTALAARANATAGHAMDYDDTQLSSAPDRTFGLLTHPTIPALGAALAVAEHLGASGERLLQAFLVGFEVECKMTEAISPAHYEGGFHSSGTLGTFGAAAAAAKLLQLPVPQIEMALGIAASMASGIRVSFGSMTKPLHVGRAAENGVTAAELAALGFTSGASGLDGPWGFFQVFGRGDEPEEFTLGHPYSIVDPGVSVKPYPCGSLSHPTLDAMLALVRDHDVRPDAIARIRCRAGNNILKPLRYPKAENALQAKFCLPFLLSAVALRRRAGISEFTDDFVQSEAGQRMMARVDVVRDEEIERQGFEKMRSVVEVELVDGTRYEQESGEYRGGPDNPLTRDELLAKFTECARLALPDEAIAGGAALIEGIEEVRSVAELVNALSAPAGVAP